MKNKSKRYKIKKLDAIHHGKFYKEIYTLIDKKLKYIQWVAILMWTLLIFTFFSNYLKTTQRIIAEI